MAVGEAEGFHARGESGSQGPAGRRGKQVFSKRGELCPGHLYQSPFCLPRPGRARNLREQQRGETRANRQESLPGPRPSWTWRSVHLLDPPQLTKPIHFHPPQGLTWSLHCQNMELASTPGEELQRLPRHGPGCPPWPQVSVWTQLSFLGTKLQPFMHGLQAGSTHMPGRGGPRKTLEASAYGLEEPLSSQRLC